MEASRTQDHLILLKATPVGPPRRVANRSDATLWEIDDEIAATEPPLIVPYSPLDPSQPSTLPAALEEWKPTTGADEALVAETERLAEAFFQQMGNATEDPRDTGYQQRWLQAQEENDSRMRASLGGYTWLHRHREAHRQIQKPAVDGAAQNAAGR